ncbi:GAF domain-containing protein [Variovorax sp. M-6]|uniref:GAF domain-containing protein n=1 Tax=Variovorax sp. M-6 TaxID=3233041 RepID=UPI003F9B16B9
MHRSPRPSLADIRPCLEGAIPAAMATCGVDGTPNVTFISQVFYVDEHHVALSFQFFNKTRQNILSNPQAMAVVLHPVTAESYRIHIRYLRTETQGAIYEGMKAQLAGIASHSGMTEVFALRGSDIYSVEAIESIESVESRVSTSLPRASPLGAVRRGSERLSRCTGLADMLNVTLSTLNEFLGVRYAIVLLLDHQTRRLYAVATCGYMTSGIGSEIAVGEGVIGVAAQECTPVRIVHMSLAYSYHHAIRSSLLADSSVPALETDIPFPGLVEPHSQMAAPIISGGRLLGVLFAESPVDARFDYQDEDALVSLASHLGTAIDLAQCMSDATESPAQQGSSEALRSSQQAALKVRHFHANDSVFLGDSYLIKGVAGAIFWKLVCDFNGSARTEFTNRELRLDPSLGLPGATDNLEARLLMLQRRLDEYSADVRIERTGRGRFRLLVRRPLELIDMTC